jgi:predicted metal-dependent hydrolase
MERIDLAWAFINSFNKLMVISVGMGIFSVTAGTGSGTGPADSVRYGDIELFYRVTYSRKRKSLAIVLHRPDGIEIKAPAGISLSSIRAMVLSKSPWILKKLAVFADEGPRSVQRNYETGELFHYLGLGITLDIIEDGNEPLKGCPGCGPGIGRPGGMTPGGARPPVTFCGSTITVTVPGRFTEQERRYYVKKTVLSWYRDRSIQIIGERVQFFSSVLAIPAPEFRVRNIKRRWGSCSADNHLSFNMRLVMAPEDQIDYVVLHEMCHIFHKDHQAGFWAVIGRYMPDYKERRARLKRDGWHYVL